MRYRPDVPALPAVDATLYEHIVDWRVPHLGFAVDIYDDRVLIEAIDRMRLPAAQYPFQVGDELISVDGKSTEESIAEFSRFFKRANPRATRRSVADFLTNRPQSRVPRAIDLPDEAVVVIGRDGGLEETSRSRGSRPECRCVGSDPRQPPSSRRRT